MNLLKQILLHPIYLFVLIAHAAIISISCSSSKIGEATDQSGISKAQNERPPNFIVIYGDDLGYGDLSSFGNPTIRTPHLDRMAMEGQKWTQFYVADPVCTPSRAALMTGRYPIRNGMCDPKRSVLFPNSSGGLPQSEVTIAEVLKQKNYATAIIGKWHLGHLQEHLPNTQGFDYYYGIPYSNDMDLVEGAPRYRQEANDPNFYADTKFYNVPLIENTTVIERPCDQTTITKRYTEKAVEYIKQNKDNPFFLYLPHSLPHIPLFAHKDFVGNSPRGLYGDIIEEIDWGVGQILEAVKSQGLENNTIVIFSSDNGPWLSFKTHGGSAGPLRAGKGTCFEGGQRVPTIMWGPGGYVKPGIINQMGSTLDLITTFASLSGTKAPSDRKMDSYDLSDVMRSHEASPRNEFYYWAKAELHAARIGSYKLHIKQREEVNYGRVQDMDNPELYNLETDISEKHDLYENMPDKVLEIQNAIAAHLSDTADAMPSNLSAKIED